MSGEEEDRVGMMRQADNIYGPAHISGDSVVHQGNITNSVHVKELHIHPNLYFEPLRLAHPVARLSHYGSRFLQVGRRIVQHEQRSDVRKQDLADQELKSLLEDMYSMRDLVEDLPSIQNQLSTMSGLQSSLEFATIIGNALSDANSHASSISQFQRAVLSLVHLPERSNLLELKQAFKQSWEQQGLSEQVKALSSYHGNATRGLDHMINSSGVIPMERFKEVITVNDNAKNGSRPISAIFTTATGQSVAINGDEDLTGAFDGSVRRSLITYNFHEEMERKVSDQLGGLPEPLHVSSHLRSAPDFLSEALNLLNFDGENDREIEVKAAHSKTFSWMFTNHDSTFPVWLSNERPCYWISGKAGSGKSTLMKYINQHPQFRVLLKRWAADRKIIIATFFFWYAGRELQKSQEGILRSLLHQILRQRPDLVTLVLPQICRNILQNNSSRLGLKGSGEAIGLSQLTEAFGLLAERLPNDVAICLLIDGVDEFVGDHYEFAKFLTELTQNSAIKLVVSSRPVPECRHAFMEFPSIRLQDLTQGDIRAYIEDKLLRDPLFLERKIIQPVLIQEIESALITKASGVFLWIVLVVKRLLLGLRRYDTPDSLLAVIDRLPSDLEKLYDHMFGKLSSDEQRAGSKLLQLMVFAQRLQETPIAAIQLYVTEVADNMYDLSDTNVLYDRHVAEARVKFIDGLLQSRCCGLLEVQYQGLTNKLLEEPSVDFLHRTIYDYIRSEETWQKVRMLFCLDEQSASSTLLASCVHLMRRVVAFSGRQSSERLQDLFMTSLMCSLPLQKMRRTSYVPLLSVAVSVILNHWAEVPNPESMEWFIQAIKASWMEVINEKLQELLGATSHAEAYLSDDEQPTGDKPVYPTADQFKTFYEESEESKAQDAIYILRGVSLTCQLTCTFAIGPLHDFFKHELVTRTRNPADKALVLSYLLNASRSAGSPLMPLFVQNIAALLENGVNPNIPANCPDGTGSAFPFRLVSLFNHGQPDVLKVVPWRFWVFVCHATNSHHIEITQMLLKAGADMQSSTWRQESFPDVALERLWAAMNVLRTTLNNQSSNLETKARLDDILAMVQPDKDQSSRKRKSSPIRAVQSPLKRLSLVQKSSVLPAENT